ncbi:MAG: cobalt transporter CbiM [Bryobacteraceae bacterium]
MHIPDGYLSPSTCAVLYAGAAPFWYVATKRVSALLHTRLVPLLSLFAAFSFVLMMFNLPLPGGTTGHAAGIGIASVVLGPWASILAISMALIIQAVFFGDGGITAIGANCFNMAAVGSIVAYGVYRAVSAGAPLDSPRRVMAAGLGGYLGINMAALLTAIEFGVQPMLFHDASGTPLYAPYPLKIAVPAMMIGHITVAGLAEFFVTAGLVAYLQRTDLSLLKLTAPGAAAAEIGARGAVQSTRGLWIILGLLMILTPLGILAAGTAWGEWGPADFREESARAGIAAASGGVAPPKQAPQGLSRLADFWTAPIPDYAPPFFKSPQLGYALSAFFGVGLTILAFQGIAFVAGRARKS